MGVRRKRLTVGEIRPVKSPWPPRESRKAAGAGLVGGWSVSERPPPGGIARAFGPQVTWALSGVGSR